MPGVRAHLQGAVRVMIMVRRLWRDDAVWRTSVGHRPSSSIVHRPERSQPFKQSSQRASGKIADAQERFKAGAVVQGYSLDEEIEETLTRPQPSAAKAKVVNKYSVTMEQKRLAQQQAKATS